MMSKLAHIRGHLILSAFLLLLSLLPSSISLPDHGQNVPYMTWDVDEVAGKSFDYIVVGGGAAGCPLAATLSERFSVLLIERGGSPYGNPLVADKKHFGLAFLAMDEFSSVAQSFTSKDGVPNLRGRVLGGSTAINAGFYSRASADFMKRVGWDKELVKKAYEWVESKVVFVYGLMPWQSVVKLGLLEAGILPYNGVTFEHVKGTKVGGTIFDEYGARHTSADLLRAGNPEKITILLNATVKNIIFHKEGSESIARGVRFIKSDGNATEPYEAYLNAGGNVILSAGALGSPQILLLSGIGPKEHLNKFDIPVVVDLKSVGRNFSDNPSIARFVDTSQYHSPDTPQVAGIAKAFKYIIEGGILQVGTNTTRRRISMKLAFPKSKGKLELENTDPRKNPSVRFNYLKEQKDLDECVQMARLLNRIARTPSITSYLGTPLGNKFTSNPNELKDYCGKNVRTFYHYHGGCTVGSVVDRDYKVYGVKGLRVIDGSTFLESPGTNPMATLFMLGRYQGLKILKEKAAKSRP